MESLNKKLALLLWAKDKNGNDDVALFSGVLEMQNDTYILRRTTRPHPVILEEWISRIKPVDTEQLQFLENAEYCLSLSVGEAYETDASFEGFGLKWPQ